jgi:hypothetical protein
VRLWPQERFWGWQVGQPPHSVSSPLKVMYCWVPHASVYNSFHFITDDYFSATVDMVHLIHNFSARHAWTCFGFIEIGSKLCSPLPWGHRPWRTKPPRPSWQSAHPIQSWSALCRALLTAGLKEIHCDQTQLQSLAVIEQGPLMAPCFTIRDSFAWQRGRIASWNRNLDLLARICQEKQNWSWTLKNQVVDVMLTRVSRPYASKWIPRDAWEQPEQA